jgi:hypothetical protein
MPNGQWITVPAGTKGKACRGMQLGGTCTQRIFMSTDPRTGNATAVQCDVPGGREPSVAKIKGSLDLFAGEVQVFDGKGTRHNPVCPDRQRIIDDIRERERSDVPARKRA